jgi:hypothetical protein
VSGDWRFTDEPYGDTDPAALLPRIEPVAPMPRAGSACRRNVSYLAALIAAVGLAAVYERGPSVTASRPAVPPPSNRVSTPAGPPTAARAPVNTADPLRDLKVQAYLAGPLTDYQRASSGNRACRTVPPGHAPRAAIAGAVRHVLPQVSAVDSSAIMDEFEGLCSIELRARDRSGTIAVITVTVPASSRVQRMTLSTAAEVIGGTTSTLVRATTATGWTVRVGATGPAAAQPSAGQLAALAEDPALTW